MVPKTTTLRTSFEYGPLLFDDGVPPLLELEDDPDGGEDDQEAEGDHRSGDAVPSRYQNLCLDVWLFS